MSKRLEGNLVVAPEHKFALVICRFNEFFTSKLVGGAVDSLKRHGARDDQIYEVWVPGAFEIPVVASRLAKTGRVQEIIEMCQKAEFDTFALRGRQTNESLYELPTTQP